MLIETCYAITMDYRMPCTLTIMYVIYSIRTNMALKNIQPVARPFFSLLTFIMIIHNIILCLFSAITFYRTFPIVYAFFKTQPLRIAITDPNNVLYGKLRFWFWIFYLSKIYEIIDSLILHWNKRSTSFLQMFHHAGAIICCWMSAASESHLTWIFTVLNSFIHTLMYTYYLLVTLRVRVSWKLKRVITRLQIIQFVLGVFIALFHVYYGKVFSSDAKIRHFQYSAISSNIIYVALLFVLFRRFENRTYIRKHKSA